MEKQIHITTQDKQRLQDCLEDLEKRGDKRELPHIQYLEKELARAEIIVDPTATPQDVITMRSKVRLRDEARQTQMECTLVYPAENAPEDGLISVLAPLGAAMLGYRVGDTFEVRLPKGPTEYRVEEILYQPESAGDYDL